MDDRNGCLIWVALFFICVYGCTTRSELNEAKEEIKQLRNKSVVVEVEKE